MNENKSGSSTWDSLEPIVTFAGKWAWLWGLIYGVFYIIWGIYTAVVGARLTAIGIPNNGVAIGIWQIIGAIISIAIAMLWVKPKFSTPCGEKDWEKLLADVVVLGNLKIPWMLIMGVVLEIFGYGWGGLAVLICALLIIFLGPHKYEWKVSK